MKVLLWCAAIALTIGALLATALPAGETNALQYRWCWCVKMDETWACRGHVVSRTCWEVPLCRDPAPVGGGEMRCWQRQRGEIGTEIRQPAGDKRLTPRPRSGMLWSLRKDATRR